MWRRVLDFQMEMASKVVIVAANIVNKHSRITENGQPSSLSVRPWLPAIPRRNKTGCYEMLHRADVVNTRCKLNHWAITEIKLI